MDHQDFKDVKWQGGASNAELARKQRAKAPGPKPKPIDTDDPPPPPKVARSLQIMIQTGRMARGWSQKTLADKLNLRTSVVNGYEAGTAIPDGPTIARMSRALGIKLSNK